MLGMSIGERGGKRCYLGPAMLEGTRLSGATPDCHLAESIDQGLRWKVSRRALASPQWRRPQSFTGGGVRGAAKAGCRCTPIERRLGGACGKNDGTQHATPSTLQSQSRRETHSLSSLHVQYRAPKLNRERLSRAVAVSQTCPTYVKMLPNALFVPARR